MPIDTKTADYGEHEPRVAKKVVTFQKFEVILSPNDSNQTHNNMLWLLILHV